MTEELVPIEGIKTITLPSSDELKTMSIEQLSEWRDKLYPYYLQRSEILRDLGMEEWKKASIWPFLYQRVEVLKGMQN